MNNILRWTRSNFVYLGAVAFAFLYYWLVFHKNKVMHQRGKYTIGYVTGWRQTLKSGRSIDYQCAVNGITYSSSVLEEKGMNSTVGTRYLVEYDSTAPELNYIYYHRPLSIRLGNAPLNGWNKASFDILAKGDSAYMTLKIR